MYVAAGPCQPYTTQSNSAREAAPQHEGFGAIFDENSAGSILSRCRQLLPRVYVGENVEGMRHGGSSSWVAVFMQKLKDIKSLEDPNKKHFRHVFEIREDSKTSTNMSRPRSVYKALLVTRLGAEDTSVVGSSSIGSEQR